MCKLHYGNQQLHMGHRRLRPIHPDFQILIRGHAETGISIFQGQPVIAPLYVQQLPFQPWDTDSKTGKKLNKPIDDFNHLMDAMRYALEDFSRGDTFSFE